MDNQKIGNVINITEIYKQILALGYVESIQTKYIPAENPNDVWSVEGLSFACYTNTLINGADFEVFTSAKKLHPFQFGKLYADTLINIIEVSSDLTTNITNTRF